MSRAGLEKDISALHKRKAVYVNWLTVRDWKSEARLPGKKPQNRQINDLFVAVCHETDGVMKWLESIFRPS